MKKVIMLILLVVIGVISLNAKSNEDMSEYELKWYIMQERAKRFKQETEGLSNKVCLRPPERFQITLCVTN